MFLIWLFWAPGLLTFLIWDPHDWPCCRNGKSGCFKKALWSLKTLSHDILDISHSKPAAFPPLNPWHLKREVVAVLQSRSAFVTWKGERLTGSKWKMETGICEPGTQISAGGRNGTFHMGFVILMGQLSLFEVVQMILLFSCSCSAWELPWHEPIVRFTGVNAKTSPGSV